MFDRLSHTQCCEPDTDSAGPVGVVTPRQFGPRVTVAPSQGDLSRRQATVSRKYETTVLPRTSFVTASGGIKRISTLLVRVRCGLDRSEERYAAPFSAQTTSARC